MNAAYAHLLFNHISIFTVAFGVLALCWAMFRGVNDMLWLAIGLFVVSGIFVWVASQTGEGAEELVEHLPGVFEGMIKLHEEAAELANIAVSILAGAALGLIVVKHFAVKWLKPAQAIVLVLALVCSGFLARAAMLGGKIRHTEIRDTTGSTSAQDQGKEQDDD